MATRDDVLAAVAGKRVSPSGWARGNCPLCELKLGKADRKGCLGLYVPTGRWHCFRCGSGGKVRDMPDELAAAAPATPAVEETRRAMEPPDGFYRVTRGPGLSSAAHEPARRYLYAPRELGGRALDPEVVHAARVGACATGRYQGRVVVPVLDEAGEEWLGWSARVWLKEKDWLDRCEAVGVPRWEAAEDWRAYLYPKGMLRGVFFYNHRALLEETDEPALVVEGVFDVLCDQVGLDRGVAALGKPSAAQVEALVAAKRPVVFLLDGDAWREAEALSLRLRFEGQRSGYVRLPPKTDPDELPRAWVDRAARDSLLAS